MIGAQWLATDFVWARLRATAARHPCDKLQGRWAIVGCNAGTRTTLRFGACTVAFHTCGQRQARPTIRRCTCGLVLQAIRGSARSGVQILVGVPNLTCASVQFAAQTIATNPEAAILVRCLHLVARGAGIGSVGVMHRCEQDYADKECLVHARHRASLTWFLRRWQNGGFWLVSGLP